MYALHMESVLTSQLAILVSQAMSRNHMSLRELADTTGIPTTTLHRRIHAHSAFTFSELHAIAKVLDTTVTDLVAQAEQAAA